ncbi:PspA/IM30 family protein [Bacillus solitudinis]|uniref:PspA/IM30 family protein n=1 Tax=Bacillus solitudinis TaxID=2014074 RepID=UPI000C233009|nr:PspA/IM30 family protein [Bacillus solitudinis]
MPLTRIRRLVEATIHEGLDHLEEPVMMVKQYMRDLKAEMSKVEEAIEKQKRLHHLLTHDLQVARELMNRRDAQATLAIEAGEEDLARRALLSKKQAFEQIQKYEGLLKTSEKQLEERNIQLEQVRKKYLAFRDKKIELTLRVQAVKAEEQLKQFKKKDSTRAIEEGFERIEDRVFDMEIRTKQPIENYLSPEADATIEEELQEMKEKLMKDKSEA